MPFIWRVSRDGYRWTGAPGARILQPFPARHGHREYAPLDEFTGLFLTFSATQPTEEGITAFANQYGLLGVTIRQTSRTTRQGPVSDERFDAWAKQIKAMAACVVNWERLRAGGGPDGEKEDFYHAVNERVLESTWSTLFGLPLSAGDKQRVIELKLADLRNLSPLPLQDMIAAVRKTKVVFELNPANLLNAMWLQFSHAVVADTHFRQCRSCGSWFAVSPEQRRADARYCRDACRIRAYKRRRTDARQLFAEGNSLKAIAKELGTTAEVVEGWIREPKA